MNVSSVVDCKQLGERVLTYRCVDGAGGGNGDTGVCWRCTGGHCSCRRWSNGSGPAAIIIVNAWCRGVVRWVVDAWSGNPPQQWYWE